MRIYYRIKNAIKIGWWAYKNPTTLQEHNFKMLSDLMELILKVATEDRHMMTHLAYVHPDEGEQQIVSIWAGAGMGAEPTKRIAELLSENSKLKAQLSICISQKEQSVTHPNEKTTQKKILPPTLLDDEFHDWIEINDWHLYPKIVKGEIVQRWNNESSCYDYTTLELYELFIRLKNS